ncbi:MAG: di-trans,poly-cis-decaprenylcistransferase [Acidobacteria bacterium]|nr:di-trans,poly-cis-decaprenylcistransferase [Acidobacteriota bacterium]
MDGSGRWATSRGRPREEGHEAGAAAVRRTVEAAEHLGLGTLTLFAFSGDNWRRPSREVANLMHIFEEYFRRDLPRWIESGTRLSVVGRRDRFAPQLQEAIEIAEAYTAEGRGLHLRIALDYSGRDSILQAARLLRRRFVEPTREAFAGLLGEITNSGGPSPDIDLLIRTGGELRMSDFMLWEAAYAELIFTDQLWPDFCGADLVAAVCEYHTRDRRFGRIEELIAS